MKAIVEAVAVSIVAEVADAGSWTLQHYNPIWRNPVDGEVLSVYGPRTIPGEFRTTGSTEDIHEIIVEYYEAATTQATTLERDETAELAAYDVAESIREWSLDHQTFPTQDVHRFDWIETAYTPGVPREAYVRYCRLVFHARETKTYG